MRFMETTQKVTGRAWAITMFFTLFMAVMTLNLIIFPACAGDTMELYGVGQAQLSTLSSVTSLVGVFTGILFGRLLDVGNVKRNIAVFMIIGIALFYVRAFVYGYVWIIILTFAASLCVGICQVAAGKVVSSWFPPERVGPAMNFQVAGAGIGSALSFLLGGYLGLHRSLLLIPICYTVLWVYWLIVGKMGPYGQTEGETAKPEKGSARKVYTSKNLWMIIIAYSLAVTSSLIVNQYLINSFVYKGLGATQASLMGTFLNLALLIGGFIMTPILAGVKRFNPLLAICMLGSAVLILLGWFLPLGGITWFCLIAGGIVFGGSLGLCVGRVPLIPMTGDFTPENIGSASGFTESIKGLISFVLPIIVATVFGTNFNAIFIVFAICGVATVICGCVAVPELGEKGKLAQEQAKAAQGEGGAPEE